MLSPTPKHQLEDWEDKTSACRHLHFVSEDRIIIVEMWVGPCTSSLSFINSGNSGDGRAHASRYRGSNGDQLTRTSSTGAPWQRLNHTQRASDAGRRGGSVWWWCGIIIRTARNARSVKWPSLSCYSIAIGTCRRWVAEYYARASAPSTQRAPREHPSPKLSPNFPHAQNDHHALAIHPRTVLEPLTLIRKNHIC